MMNGKSKLSLFLVFALALAFWSVGAAAEETEKIPAEAYGASASDGAGEDLSGEHENPGYEEEDEADGYIVVLNDLPVQLMDSSGSEPLPELEEVYAPEMLYRVQDEEDVERLAEEGLLVRAEPNYYVELFDTPDDTFFVQGNQDYLLDVGMSYCWEHGINGKTGSGAPVRVGIVDSGIYAGHEDLEGAAVLEGTNFLASETDPDRNDTEDQVGHGTFIAGIIAARTGNGQGIAGMAPEVELVPLKCFGDSKASIAEIIAAIYAGVNDYHCQVLNMSFGTADQSNELKAAITDAYNAGVILVAAAGNLKSSAGSTGNDPLMYPGSYDEVICVGALGTDKTVASFSCQNSGVAITAPGVSVYSLTKSGEYGSGSGTSYAAPVVTAAAALALSVRPDLTQEEFSLLLEETALDLGEEGRDNTYGWGMVQIDRLLERLSQDSEADAEGGFFENIDLTDCLLIMAAYDGSGRLLTAYPVETPDLSAPTLASAGDWKLFVLDKESLVPLYPAIEAP